MNVERTLESTRDFSNVTLVMSHKQTAKEYGWKEVPVKPGDVGRMESYTKDGTSLNYYPTTGCVGTSMDHPSQGKTQMFRRDVPVEDLMANPRAHTSHGDQTKK